MDAIWFWFAKFLVELGIVVGLVVVFIIISFFLDMRK